MRTLEKHELPFWNGTSLIILIDVGFTFELNDGKIVGIENTFVDLKVEHKND